MTETTNLPSLPEWLSENDHSTWPELNDRDSACLVLPDLDYESQLAAIHHALRGHREADGALKREIAEIAEFAKKTSGLRNQRAVDEWCDRLHESVYQDAARSMAAVGMLAPMTESVFYQAFQGIRRETLGQNRFSFGSHERWCQTQEDQWNCHYVWSKGRRNKDLVKGIMQLADATGLQPYLPQNLEHTLQALFEYRNKMFHHGFEWPLVERRKFATRIRKAGWQSDWFTKASRGDDPWVFYMSEPFIKHAMKMIDHVIEGMGKYCKERLSHGRFDKEPPG